MRNRSWRNSDYSPVRGRIDTRNQADPAVAAGIRGIHRDTGGNVIGGYSAEGSPMGTKRGASAVGGSATPRLDAGVQTPRLDSNPSQPIRYGTPEVRAAEMQSAARKSTLSGAFGIGAQRRAENLQGRQSLFSRMQSAGAGGISPAMKQEAAKLGVTAGGWRNALGKLPAAPSMVSAPGARPAISPMRPAEPMPKPAAAPMEKPWRMASR